MRNHIRNATLSNCVFRLSIMQYYYKLIRKGAVYSNMLFKYIW